MPSSLHGKIAIIETVFCSYVGRLYPLFKLGFSSASGIELIGCSLSKSGWETLWPWQNAENMQEILVSSCFGSWFCAGFPGHVAHSVGCLIRLRSASLSPDITDSLLILTHSVYSLTPIDVTRHQEASPLGISDKILTLSFQSTLRGPCPKALSGAHLRGLVPPAKALDVLDLPKHRV